MQYIYIYAINMQYICNIYAIYIYICICNICNTTYAMQYIYIYIDAIHVQYICNIYICIYAIFLYFYYLYIRYTFAHTHRAKSLLFKKHCLGSTLWYHFFFSYYIICLTMPFPMQTGLEYCSLLPGGPHRGPFCYCWRMILIIPPLTPPPTHPRGG